MTTATMLPIEPIQVRHYGEGGPLLILLHGGPGAPGSMAPLARNLCSRFRVLEALQRTSGSVPLTVDRHATDLYGVLRGSLEEGPHDYRRLFMGGNACREISRCGHVPWMEEEARQRFYTLLRNEIGQESSSV